MSMTSDLKVIKEYTNGLEPGNLYINSLDTRVDYSLKEEALFDECTFNFHLYPTLTDSNILLMKSICDNICKLRENIFNKLVKCENVIEVANEKELDEKILNDGILYTTKSVGRSGNIRKLYGTKYSTNEINRLFRFIRIDKNGVTYYLNFMRFFISKDKKVNCIYNMYQFDCCLKNNKEKSIAYPTAYQSQSINTLQKNIKNCENGKLYYNPQLSFDDDVDTVLNSFIEFIDICDKHFREK